MVTFTNNDSHTILLTVVGENTAATGDWISTYQFLFTQLQTGLPQSPRISGVAMSGDSLILSGNNGIQSATYYVLASTNLALPAASWNVITTNIFDANGNFIFTNTSGTGVPDQFYLLKYQLLELP